MRMSQDPMADFAETVPRPVLATRALSLAVAVPTAMVLVDYALQGLGTPTAGVQDYAAAMPGRLVAGSHPVRAVLAHGTVLRDLLYSQIPDGHPAHREWRALRQWLLERGDEWVEALVEYGLDCLAAYDEPGGAGVRDPALATAPRGSLAGRRQEAVAALKGWGVAGPQRRAAEVLDAAGVREVLVALLDHIWDGWLADALACLPQVPAQASPAPDLEAALSTSQWVAWTTGLRPGPGYAARLDAASRVSVMACPGLGQSLSLFEAGGEMVTLYSPQPASLGPGQDAPALTELGTFGQVMRALGDPTRLAIVLRLLGQGPMTMSELTESLDVHQSTISRQVAALRKAQLLADDDQRRLTVRRDLIRQAAGQLRSAADQ